MGARVVLQASVDAPQRVAGLVLVEGSRVGTGDPEAAELAVRQRIAAVGYPAFLRGLFADMFLEGSDPAPQERIVDRALALPEAVGAALIPRIVGWDARSLEAALANVEVPLLVIQSTYVNPERVRVPLAPGTSSPWLDLVRGAVPAAEVDVVGGAGHYVIVEQPEAVNRRLEAFLIQLVRAD
jgi:pimeloyl-ACP methyl ester carboxylesterase